MCQYLIVIFTQIQLLRTDSLNTERCVSHLLTDLFPVGPRNLLPEHIQTVVSMHIFKKLLKHHLFKLACLRSVTVDLNSDVINLFVFISCIIYVFHVPYCKLFLFFLCVVLAQCKCHVVVASKRHRRQLYKKGKAVVVFDHSEFQGQYGNLVAIAVRYFQA